MKNILANILILSAFLFPSVNYGQNVIELDDLNILMGDWKGSLTYIDYNTNEPYTMPADLVVKKGKNAYQLILFSIYSNEPNANSKDKINISKDGTQINKIDIKSVENLSSGQLRIITEYLGKDNKKKAQIRNVYTIGKAEFIIRKDVKLVGSNNWIMRNEYSYTRY